MCHWIPCHKRCRGISLCPSDTSCACWAASEGWRFLCTSDTGIWMGPTRASLVVVSPPFLALARLRGSWCHGRHWLPQSDSSQVLRAEIHKMQVSYASKTGCDVDKLTLWAMILTLVSKEVTLLRSSSSLTWIEGAAALMMVVVVLLLLPLFLPDLILPPPAGSVGVGLPFVGEGVGDTGVTTPPAASVTPAIE